MTVGVDQATTTRSGEELDRDALQDFLSGAFPAAGGIEDVSQFPGGASNLTYLLRTAGGEFVLRRPPFGTKAATAHDMGREYRVLTRLRRQFPYCPEPVAFCDDRSVLGEPFYLMRRIAGLILRRDLPRGLSLSADRARALCRSLVEVHLELHRVDFIEAGLADLGRPEGYTARQVEGWSNRYRNARTPDVPGNEFLMDWLASSQPPEPGRAAVIHNDFKFDNVVLDPNEPTRIIGLLDWEMSTLGDPLMDLGTFISYWVEKTDDPMMQFFRGGPSDAEGALTREQLVERYSERTGREVKLPHFYYAFGLFKTAVVIQQIYYRYKQGLTNDERFALFGHGVVALCEQAARAIERAK